MTKYSREMTDEEIVDLVMSQVDAYVAHRLQKLDPSESGDCGHQTGVQLYGEIKDTVLALVHDIPLWT